MNRAQWITEAVALVLGRLALTVAFLLNAMPAVAQHSSLRGWGCWSFDTRGRDSFCVDVQASVYMTAVLTADGRIYTNGENTSAHGEVPPLPPGRRYVSMDVNWYG